ncbi:MAG TPA: PaaI family thioesterase [Sphingobium sp.]|uniref:PaaI family thioesterase n=1 Tax=Sphingobium sp. TaxID=1912891 RepID=UPI002ED299FB
MFDGNGQFDPAAFEALLSGHGHNSLLGHRYHAHGPDWVELAMPWQEALVGDRATGAFAAGPVISLMDNTAGTAVWMKRGGFLSQVTVDLRVDHVRPIATGATLIARCTCYRLSGPIAFVRGVGYDVSPDDPACQVNGTFMLIEGQGA